AEGSMPVDPGVVARLRASAFADAFQLRQWLWIQRPALGAVTSRRIRTVQRSLALAPIEAREMAARQRRPVHAVAIDVAAARRVAGHRRLVHFGERGLRRIRSRHQPYDGAREA